MIRNRTAEQDIRNELSSQGYYGESARFDELELHAVGRPGWVQVFRFSVEVKHQDGSWQSLFGLLCDDERTQSTKIHLTSSFQSRERMLAEWSEDLIVAKPRRSDSNASQDGFWRQLAIVVLLVVVALGLLSLIF